MKKTFNKPLTYVNGGGVKALYAKQKERRILL